MRLSAAKLQKIISDLNINAPYVKGQDLPVRNCFHFSTDGNAVDAIFRDGTDFIDGMNRIFTVLQLYDTTILAFVLMDTHVHFILHGEFSECNRFIHEYVRRTSQYISNRYGERNKLDNVPINHQIIDSVRYLKTAICYVLKNPPAGGIKYNAYDYPWSSAALMFRPKGLWTSPDWTRQDTETEQFGMRKQKIVFKTHQAIKSNPAMCGKIIFPGEYVPYEIVEAVFRSHKAFNIFMCVSKETDVESRGGAISRLSIPMQEMRQHKNELCLQMFGRKDIRLLNTAQRIMLAKALKSRYDSSVRQIVRLCGLIMEEAGPLL